MLHFPVMTVHWDPLGCKGSRMILFNDFEIRGWILITYIQIGFLRKEAKIGDRIHFIWSISVLVEKCFGKDVVNLKRVKFAKHICGKRKPCVPIASAMYSGEQIEHRIKF